MADFKAQAVPRCQALIKKACLASYDQNPPFICTQRVRADPQTAIGSGDSPYAVTIIYPLT